MKQRKFKIRGWLKNVRNLRVRKARKVQDPKWCVPRVRQMNPLRHPSKLFEFRFKIVFAK